MPGAIAEDVPSNRSRSGGILAEGSPQGRIGMGSEYHPGHWAPHSDGVRHGSDPGGRRCLCEL